jgi:hypothetical protein
VAGGGGFTIVSDDLSTYGDEEHDLLTTVLAAGRRADGPLDLVDPFAPVLEVRSPGTVLRIDVGRLGGDGDGDGGRPGGRRRAGVLVDGGPVTLQRRR